MPSQADDAEHQRGGAPTGAAGYGRRTPARLAAVGLLSRYGGAYGGGLAEARLRGTCWPDGWLADGVGGGRGRRPGSASDGGCCSAYGFVAGRSSWRHPVRLGPASRRCRASDRGPDVVGGRGRRAPTSAPARRAGRRRGSWAARIVAYCAGQLRPEQQRVVGAERDGGAGREQRRQRHRGQVGVDAERHVGDRADLEGDAGLDDPVEQRRVLGGADAVAEPVARERVEADPDVLGAAQLAAVRGEQQPGPLGDRGRPGRSRRCCRGARRWRARSRPRRGRRTGRRGGPACGRRAGAGCGWRR